MMHMVGRGVVCVVWELEHEVDLHIGTFSKTYELYSAYVAGNEKMDPVPYPHHGASSGHHYPSTDCTG